MKGYKGFNPGLICIGKQYAENTVFEEDRAVICNSGMHFCENPLDVLDYYPLLNDDAKPNDFAEVEALADTKTDDQKKYCTTKLKVGAKLSIPGFIKACVDFLLEKTMIPADEVKKMVKETAASGDSSKLAASGNYSQLAASGDSSKLAASGNYSQLAASGNYSKLAASGDSSKLAASGHSSQLAASGNYSQLAASGDSSQLAASGHSGQLAASGDSSQLAASGNSSKLAASGKHSVVAGIGIGNKAKAIKGCWITLAEWEWNDDEDTYIPECVKTEFVDGERIKENVFYKLENGVFVEVK